MELSLKSKFPFPGTITPSGRVLTCALLQSNPAKQPGGLQGKHARQRSDRSTANRGFCYKINIRKIWWNTSKAAGLQRNSSNPTTLSLSHRDSSAAEQIIRSQISPFLSSVHVTLSPWRAVTHCLRSARHRSMSDTFPLVGRLFNYQCSWYLNLANYWTSPLNNASTVLIRFCVVVFFFPFHTLFPSLTVFL